MRNITSRDIQISSYSNPEIDSLERDLVIAREIQDSKTEAQLLIKLGSIYYSETNYDKALECYQQSLNKAQEII